MTNLNSWTRRRWTNFRQGHSVYLIFALTFANFILIFHRLLIQRVEFLSEIFSNLLTFALVFVIIYIPLAVLIGHWHRKTQLKIEMELMYRQSPLLAKWFRVLFDMQTGKATKEEIESTRNLLKAIEDGKDMIKDDKNP